MKYLDLIHAGYATVGEDGSVIYGGHYEYNDKIENIVEQLAAQLKEGVTDDKATNYAMWGVLCSLSEAGNTLYSVPEIRVVIPGQEDKGDPRLKSQQEPQWTGQEETVYMQCRIYSRL